MFEFFRRKLERAPTSAGARPPLIFKDGVAALEYACKFLDCPLEEGAFLPAVVLDSRELFGTEQAVKIQDDGNQLGILRVASKDGGFIIPATTAGAKGPILKPGQLVAWQAMKYLPEMGNKLEDKRSAWVGLIVGTLKPEHQDENWVGDGRFSP